MINSCHNVILVDCTLRDGGYHNNWDFKSELVNEYLVAMCTAKVDYVELGFRSLNSSGFRGACAFTTDKYIRSLSLPIGLKLGVMVNASELLGYSEGAIEASKILFTHKADSPISLVRIACHAGELEEALPACLWLKKQGYQVGVNLMQVSERSETELESLSELISRSSIDVLYFADSLGSMDSASISRTMLTLRTRWKGDVGIHAHDNMGLAVANSVCAIEQGAAWVDSTVMGMGRGPGNAPTEYILVELEKFAGQKRQLGPLLALIEKYFVPMQKQYVWGKNAYYYLSGRYGIHPTYIQKMLSDSRYGVADILLAIEQLSSSNERTRCSQNLEIVRPVCQGNLVGSWAPVDAMKEQEVLILGAGSTVTAHREAIERFIRAKRPYVIALNAASDIDPSCIDLRVACQPFRILVDSDKYRVFPQPLVAPWASLPDVAREAISKISHLDFGLVIEPGCFQCYETGAVTHSGLTLAYALAIASSGQAKKVLLAGVDSYLADDPRSIEINELFHVYLRSKDARPLHAITPTRCKIPVSSVYAF